MFNYNRILNIESFNALLNSLLKVLIWIIKSNSLKDI